MVIPLQLDILHIDFSLLDYHKSRYLDAYLKFLTHSFVQIQFIKLYKSFGFLFLDLSWNWQNPYYKGVDSSIDIKLELTAFNIVSQCSTMQSQLPAFFSCFLNIPITNWCNLSTLYSCRASSQIVSCIKESKHSLTDLWHNKLCRGSA